MGSYNFLLPGKVVNLLELLRLYAQNYFRLVNCISQVSTALSVPESQPMRNDLVISALGIMDGIKPQMQATGLKETVNQIDHLQTTWNMYRDHNVLSIDCAELLRRLEDEIKSKVLLVIRDDVSALYENPRADWQECIQRFPQAVDNIDEMNQCFALCRYAASVFHSLLITEAGLMELGKYIGVNDPKQGWDATCKKLKEICDLGRNKYSGQIPFNSIEQINQAIQSMKHAWRNKVNHEAGRLVVLNPEFSEKQAQEIIMATRSLMRWIAREIPKP